MHPLLASKGCIQPRTMRSGREPLPHPVGAEELVDLLEDLEAGLAGDDPGGAGVGAGDGNSAGIGGGSAG